MFISLNRKCDPPIESVKMMQTRSKSKASKSDQPANRASSNLSTASSTAKPLTRSSARSKQLNSIACSSRTNEAARATSSYSSSLAATTSSHSSSSNSNINIGKKKNTGSKSSQNKNSEEKPRSIGGQKSSATAKPVPLKLKIFVSKTQYSFDISIASNRSVKELKDLIAQKVKCSPQERLILEAKASKADSNLEQLEDSQTIHSFFEEIPLNFEPVICKVMSKSIHR